MASVIYFTSGVEAHVEEPATDVEAAIARSGQVASLTLTTGEVLYLRVDQVTHWHEVQNGRGEDRRPHSSKPRFGRGLPQTD